MADLHPKVAKEFRSPRLKLEQGRRHIQTLHSLAADYLARAKPSVRLEQFPEWNVWLHILKLDPPIPDEVQLTASDAASNLRQALDHGVCAVARCIGKTDNGVYFPFGNSPSDLETAIADKTRKLPKSVREYIRLLTPTPAGNPLLWELHHLNVPDKHRKLCAFGLHVGRFQGRIDLNSLVYKLLDSFVWNAETESLAYGVSTFPHENYELGLEPSVRFDIGGDFSQEPAAALLSTCARMVEGILDQFSVLVSAELARG